MSEFNKDKTNSVRNITFQVTEDCNMRCTYCYQHNKTPNIMTFDVAKKLIDKLLDKEFSGYIPDDSIGIILEFIGGEPLLQVELIDKVVQYFIDRTTEIHHPWATRFRIAMSSNGLCYFQDNVQAFMKKYKGLVSYGVTVDGCKELHDKCRIDKHGQPTYDKAIAAAKHFAENYGNGSMPSKMTLSPDNITYLSQAVISMIENGYTEINFNPVFERGWENKHATLYYNEIKKIADYVIDHNLMDTTPFILPHLLDSNGQPMPEDDNRNFCGGTGSMLALDYKGDLYPCLRYMHSSIGDKQLAYKIGSLENGIGYDDTTCNRLDCLNCITRRSQSTEECFNCPIATGCAWCSAYNYETFGTPNHRATFICCMHKARVLGISYMWNKYYNLKNSDERYKLNIPDEWALQIIDETELQMLKELARGENIE